MLGRVGFLSVPLGLVAMGMEHYAKVKDLGGTNGAFLAKDRQQPDRRVVIKRLANGVQGMEELNASLRMQHPHIIKFLESFVFSGALYVVMSYEPGGDLDSLFRYLSARRKTPTTHTLLLWFVQLLDALAYCHANKVIHRDIKPDNILVSEDTKHLYLGDFGSAKTLSGANFTSTFVGSPMWISPEVLLGTPYSFPADVWSLGCVFYEMATLQRPFTAPSFAHLVQQVTAGRITPLPPSLAPEVRAIILSMLVVDPEARVAAADALRIARAALARAEARRQASPPPMRSPPRPAPLSTPHVSPPPPPTAAVAASSAPLHRDNPSPPPSPPATVASAASPPQRELTTPAAPTRPTAAPLPPPASPPGSPQIMAEVEDRATPDIQTSEQAALQRPSAVARAELSPAVVTAMSRELESPAPPEAIETEPCQPQQMVFQISMTGLRKSPVKRRRKRAAPKASGGWSTGNGATPSPARQQISSIPSSSQPKNSAAARKVLAARHGSSMLDAPSKLLQSSTRRSSKVVVKRPLPPAHVAKRALQAAAIRCESNQRGPVVSPKRSGRSSPPLLINNESKEGVPRAASPAAAAGGQQKVGRAVPHSSPSSGSNTPTSEVVRPARGSGSAKVRTGLRGGGEATDGKPSKWFDARTRDLSAIEHYLHQFRERDDKVLETYDERYGGEESPAVRAASPGVKYPSPAPQRRSPMKAFSSPYAAPGVLVMTPPKRRGGADAVPSTPPRYPDHSTAASPPQRTAGGVSPAFRRQQSSGVQPSIASVPRPADSRANSLSSTYNGHQASNARTRPQLSLEEQIRHEEERRLAREKRESERLRMKEMILEQREKAKKQRRRPKKGGGFDVEIMLPDKLQYTADQITPAE